MACYTPLRGFRGYKGKLAMQAKHAPKPLVPLEVPCGKCIGCKIERTRTTAVRLTHEQRCHEKSSFLTLTYRDEALPEDGVLVKKDLQDFIRSLRDRKYKVRYYGVGEYGDRFGRPHYHVALFGEDFSADRYKWRQKGEHTLYRSDALEASWPQGHVEIGDLEYKSAAYVAGYCLKKINGPLKAKHYGRKRPDGTTYELPQEFAIMSLKPGLGEAYYRKYKHEIFPRDEVITNGKPMGVPRYYSTLLEREDPELLADIKLRRKAQAEEHRDDNTPKRLAVRKRIAQSRLDRTQRDL